VTLTNFSGGKIVKFHIGFSAQPNMELHHKSKTCLFREICPVILGTKTSHITNRVKVLLCLVAYRLMLRGISRFTQCAVD